MSEAKTASSSLLKKILQDYSDWSSQVIRAIFYPEKILRASIINPTRLKSDNPGQAHINDLVMLQKDLHDAADAMLDLGGKRPDFDSFDKFLHLYENFTERVERLEIDSVLSNFGVDVDTGLRSAHVIVADLERELDRRARRGQAFSIILSQIDDVKSETYEAQLKIAAAAIKSCMRSFDDAYLSGPNEVLVSLKQTDNAGAMRFVDRLKSVLVKKEADFTMSFCVVEPMPGEDVETLLANVRNDLRSIAKERAGDAVEFEDISPLQRFINKVIRE